LTRSMVLSAQQASSLAPLSLSCFRQKSLALTFADYAIVRLPAFVRSSDGVGSAAQHRPLRAPLQHLRSLTIPSSHDQKPSISYADHVRNGQLTCTVRCIASKLSIVMAGIGWLLASSIRRQALITECGDLTTRSPVSTECPSRLGRPSRPSAELTTCYALMLCITLQVADEVHLL
jgi:hypothetical protein